MANGIVSLNLLSDLISKHIGWVFLLVAGYVGVVIALFPFPFSVLMALFPLSVFAIFNPVFIIFFGVWVCSGIFINFTPIGSSGKIAFVGPACVIVGSTIAYLIRIINNEARQLYGDLDVVQNRVRLFSLLLVFYVIIQALVSIKIRACDVLDVLFEFAPVAMWSLIFLWPVKYLPNDFPRKAVFFAFLGFFASIIVILQAKFNVQLMAGGRVESLRTLTSTYSGVTRTVTDNIHIIVLLSLLLPAFVARFKSYYFSAVSVGVLCLMAIYFQYGRALWISYFFALCIYCALAFSARQFKYLVFVGVAVIVLLVGVFSTTESPALQAGVDRLFSVGAEVSSGSSFDWRIWENQTAINKISQYPVFGIGPGVHYRRVVDPSTFSAQTRYMHNSYLYFAMKYGLVGFSLLVAIVVMLLKYLFGLIRRKERGSWERMYLTGIFSFISMFIVLSVNQPEFLSIMSSLTFVFAVWLSLGFGYFVRNKNSFSGACS